MPRTPHDVAGALHAPVLGLYAGADAGIPVAQVARLQEAEIHRLLARLAELTRQLAGQGLVVARRTVTKYRQMLKIEAVDRRRRHA